MEENRNTAIALFETLKNCVHELKSGQNSVESLERLRRQMKSVEHPGACMTVDDDQSCESLVVTKDIEDTYIKQYNEQFTALFEDQLDKFRQEDTFKASDVEGLIQCIEYGARSMSKLQKVAYSNE